MEGTGGKQRMLLCWIGLLLGAVEAGIGPLAPAFNLLGNTIPGLNAPFSEVRTVPLTGSVAVKSNSGWVLGGWGVASPDNVRNFGPHNYGTGNAAGSSNFGDQNYGSGNYGSNNIGSGNYGSSNVGSNNCGSSNVGNNNYGSWNVGNLNGGSYNVGTCNTGSGNTGIGNYGNLTVGLSNVVQDEDVLGYGNVNVGSGVIGIGNVGAATSDDSTLSSNLIGNFNSGAGTANIGYLLAGNTAGASGNIGYGNAGADTLGNIGFFNVGANNTGSFNYGSLNIGNLNGVQNYTLLSAFTKRALSLGFSEVVDANVDVGSDLGGLLDVEQGSADDTDLPDFADLDGLEIVSVASIMAPYGGGGLEVMYTSQTPNAGSFALTTLNYQNIASLTVNSTFSATAALGWSNVNGTLVGIGNVGWQDAGLQNAGFNNTGDRNNGTLNIGVNNLGTSNIGASNTGTGNTGYDLVSGSDAATEYELPGFGSLAVEPASLLNTTLNGFQSGQAAQYPALFSTYASSLQNAWLNAPCSTANSTCPGPIAVSVTSNTFTISLSCRGSVKITDLYCSGDSYAVYKNGVLWLTTPLVSPLNDPGCLNPVVDPEEAYYTDRFAHVVGYLLSGSYTILVQPISTFYGGGGVAIKVDEFCDKDSS